MVQKLPHYKRVLFGRLLLGASLLLIACFVFAFVRKEGFAAGEDVAGQMLAAGVSGDDVRRLVKHLATFDPVGWQHTGETGSASSPAWGGAIGLVEPVATGWKKAFATHLSGAAHEMLQKSLAFPDAVFLFNAPNFTGELAVLPIETRSRSEIEFSALSHPTLAKIHLKYLAPARTVSALVPNGYKLVFLLANGARVSAVEGANPTVALTAPVAGVLLQKKDK